MKEKKCDELNKTKKRDLALAYLWVCFIHIWNIKWTFTWKCQHITLFSLSVSRTFFSTFIVQYSPHFCILHILHFTRVQLLYVTFAHAMCLIVYHSCDCIVHKFHNFLIFSFILCENNRNESTVVSDFKCKYTIECACVVCRKFCWNENLKY